MNLGTQETSAIQKLSIIIIIYQVRLWYHSVVTRGAYFCHWTTEYTQSCSSPALVTPWSCVVNIVHWQLCVMESLHRNYTANNKYCTSLCSYRLLLHGNAEIKKKKKKKHTSVSSATAFFLTIFPAARALHTARTRVTLQAHRVTEYLRHGGDSPT